MDSSEFYIQDNENIEEIKFNTARKLYQAGDYDGALKLYLDMLNTSISYKLYYDVGRCYYKLDNIDKAEDFFKSSISIENRNNLSYIYLGNIAQKRQNTSDAIKYWTIAHSMKPYDESICLNLASAYLSKGMQNYSIGYYKKYLKYAKNKTTPYYMDIKKTLDGFEISAQDLYKKASTNVNENDIQTAIEVLNKALQIFPLHFDMNYLLGKLYYSIKDYTNAIFYLKQALFIDFKSIDVLLMLSDILQTNGMLSEAFCCLKRLLPLVLKQQKEYLHTIQSIKLIEAQLEASSYEKHFILAEQYNLDNNYKQALYEYENSLILNPLLGNQYLQYIDELKVYINPEPNSIKQCMEQGGVWYSAGNFNKSNRYFSRVLLLANETSTEYKFAKSRLVNV